MRIEAFLRKHVDVIVDWTWRFIICAIRFLVLTGCAWFGAYLAGFRVADLGSFSQGLYFGFLAFWFSRK